MAVHALILASGQGIRLGGPCPKQYHLLNNKPILLYSLELFLSLSYIDQVIVVIHPHDRDYDSLFPSSIEKPWSVLRCGSHTYRSQTLGNALNSLELPNSDWILIHDAARPCIQAKDVDRLVYSVWEDDQADAGVLVSPIVDSIRLVSSSAYIEGKLQESQEKLVACQTPQMASFSILKKVTSEFPITTDESEALCMGGYRVKSVIGNSSNIKITYLDDLSYASYYLEGISLAK